MKKKQTPPQEISTEYLKAELNRELYKKRYINVLKSTVYSLIVASAVAVLIANVWLPVLRIYGSSMSPTLREGDIVVALKTTKPDRGDTVAFYIGNKILIKRCIAGPSDWVNITEDGTVYVNGEALSEPYISEKTFGQCDIQLPYQVPENRWFFMGDHRGTSLDSRHSSVGCISEEQIIGKVIFRVMPFEDFGGIR
ncbi:MAG: signal peptidase I [Anaerofustis stercorihominis]|nr:signal peptidase I [Anaerofustis stercorihominis]